MLRSLSLRILMTITMGVLALGASSTFAAATPTSAPQIANSISLTQAMSRAAAASDAGPAAYSCQTNVHIQSAANGLYVSAELGYTGNNYAMLRARASSVGPWELFNICTDTSSGLSYIQSTANGLYVSAELGYTGNNYAMLRARASSVGPWESFDIVPSGSGYVIISTANADFVAAELGYTGNNYAMLRARTSGTAGPWEQFQ